MRKLFFLFLAIPLMMTGCQLDPCGNSKDKFLHNYNDLIEEVAVADLAVSDEGWKAYDEQFRAYVEECYDRFEPEMTGREKRRFWAKSLAYYHKRYGKGMLNELADESDDVANRIRKNTEELLEKQSRNLERTLENMEKDLEGFFRDFEKDMEDFGKSLEEVFE